MSLAILVLAMLILLLVQGSVYRRWGLSRVTYDRQFSESVVWEGETVEMVERIANNKWLPLPWLRLEALMPASLRFSKQDNLKVQSGERLQNHRSLFALRPYTAVVRRHRVRCTARGSYNVATATMTSGDLFGMAGGVEAVRVDARILVYPRPAPGVDLPLPWQGWQGEYAVRRWIVEDPFLTQGVREYRPGDSMRGIHWKATARSGELQVHHRAYTADRRVMFLLNVEDSPEMWGAVNHTALVEWGIRCALTLMEGCLADGAPVGFVTNGHTMDAPKEPVWLEPGAGPIQREAILQVLAKLELSLAVPSADLLKRAAAVEGVEDAVDVAILRSELLATRGSRSERQSDPSFGRPRFRQAPVSPAASDRTDYVLLTVHRGPRLEAALQGLLEAGIRVDVLPIVMPVEAEAGAQAEQEEAMQHAAGRAAFA